MLRVREQVIAEPARLELIEDYVTPQFDGDRFTGSLLCIGARAAIDAGFIALRDTPRPGAPRTFYDVTELGHTQGSFIAELAAAALAIDESGARRLLNVESWPKPYVGSFLRASSALARATVTANRIDHFIRTEGRE
jgi:hypothetical protein